MTIKIEYLVGILLVLRLEYQKFRILEILNFHPWIIYIDTYLKLGLTLVHLSKYTGYAVQKINISVKIEFTLKIVTFSSNSGIYVGNS